MALREVLSALEFYSIYLPFNYTSMYFIGNRLCQHEGGNLMDCLNLKQGRGKSFPPSFSTGFQINRASPR